VSIEAAVESGRRLIATTLLDRGLVGHRVLVDDGSGGKMDSYVPDPAPTACRFGSLIDSPPGSTGANHSVVNEAVDSVYGPPTAQITFPLGTVVEEGDHVTNVADGSIWLVVGNKTPASAMSIALRILIREA
jgi:hypothetical protein